VTLRFAVSVDPQAGRDPAGATEEWKAGRRRIIAAILAGDPELARFEAERSNRRPLWRRRARRRRR
jgi:GntR family transcriptional regulator, transcriptional repressor for pyruvate dehydrogenase complex